MIEFDDYEQGVPFGFFITFRTYGSWLHGDERGSVDRVHNAFGSPRLLVNPARRSFEERMLAQAPVFLGPNRREATRGAIVDICDVLGWQLHALNVRTTHVHSVVTAPVHSRRILAELKARSTARMRRLACWTSDRSPWSKGGSAQPIWSAKALGRVIEYVVSCQGPDLD